MIMLIFYLLAFIGFILAYITSWLWLMIPAMICLVIGWIMKKQRS